MNEFMMPVSNGIQSDIQVLIILQAKLILLSHIMFDTVIQGMDTLNFGVKASEQLHCRELFIMQVKKHFE